MAPPMYLGVVGDIKEGHSWRALGFSEGNIVGSCKGFSGCVYHNFSFLKFWLMECKSF